MKTLILNLRAPLRSWGVASLGDDRWTEMRPTASAIIGLLGACAGINRHDKALLDAWYGAWSVITAGATDWSLEGQHLAPALRSDFQTASDSLKMDWSTNPHPVVSLRGYVEHARDSVALIFRDGADQALFELAKAGLRNPVYTPFLGRRCNPLSEPLLAPDGVMDVADVAAVADKLLAALATPGLMEDEVEIHKVDLTANAGLLTPWTQQQRQLGREVTLLRQGITDDRLGNTVTYAMRAVDVIRINLQTEEAVA